MSQRLTILISIITTSNKVVLGQPRRFTILDIVQCFASTVHLEQKSSFMFLQLKSTPLKFQNISVNSTV